MNWEVTSAIMWQMNTFYVIHDHIFPLDQPNIKSRKSPRETKNEFILSRKRFEELNFSPPSKNNSKVRKSNIPHVDFITLIIPFAFLFTVTMLICVVSMFRSSSVMPASPRHPHIFAPNIKITEPSSIVDHKEDSKDRGGANEQYLYLSPLQ